MATKDSLPVPGVHGSPPPPTAHACGAKTLGTAPKRDYRAERLLDESAGGRARAHRRRAARRGASADYFAQSHAGHLQEITRFGSEEGRDRRIPEKIDTGGHGHSAVIA